MLVTSLLLTSTLCSWPFALIVCQPFHYSHAPLKYTKYTVLESGCTAGSDLLGSQLGANELMDRADILISRVRTAIARQLEIAPLQEASNTTSLDHKA